MSWKTKKPWRGTGKRDKKDEEKDRTPHRLSPVAGPDLSPIGVIDEPGDVSWGEPSLPTHWLKEWRKHQEKAILQVTSKFRAGAKVVFLDAPTGSGKTAIAEGVRRLLDARMVYTCTTKNLQGQFNVDFPYSEVLKGRSNYSSPVEPGSCKTCSCKTADFCAGGGACPARGEGPHFDHCPDDPCPYREQKWRAVHSDVAVLNMPYLLAETNYVSNSKFRGRGMVVVDECDTLEQALMGFVEIRVSMEWQDKLSIPAPTVKTFDADSNDWADWARAVLWACDRYEPEDEDEEEKLSGLRYNVKRLDRDMRGGENATRWVYTGYEDAGPNQPHPVVFKPVTLDQVAPDVLFDKGQKFLMMSASIISVDEQVRSLGLDRGEVASVTVPSTFPPENRPIHLVPVGAMVSKKKKENYPKAGQALAKILDYHPGERVLVHTVSYEFTRVIERELRKAGTGRQLFLYNNSRGRSDALFKFKQSPGGVLLAPSFERGVDLPGELCRVQVVAKVPYPYQDKQTRARLYKTKGGQLWYTVQTIRQLIQMTGRGVRSSSDHAETYILDSKFLELYRNNKSLFPEWWREAVSMSGRRKKDILIGSGA